jgi:hypothetical protein
LAARPVASALQFLGSTMKRHPLLALSCLVAGAACAPAEDAPGDASLAEPSCPTFYRDRDGDGHGDPGAPRVACSVPFGHVRANDDCDDFSAAVHPGEADVCDGRDNDCDGVPDPACPDDCDVVVEKSQYLLCAGPRDWQTARSLCQANGAELVHVDDIRENDFLQLQAELRFDSARFHLGGTDLVSEGTWRWSDDGAPLSSPAAADQWQWSVMDFTTGGFTKPAHFNWSWYEPDDAVGREDCLGMFVGTGRWFDGDCTVARPFVCERP